MAAPRFSVVIPMYNRARFIGRALASCLSQDFGDFEIVVVDDGSIDGSPDVVASVGDPRIRLIRHEANRGRCPSRNTGMGAARGEWLVFLDSDDELLPGALRAIHARASTLGDDVGAMRFMCRDEAGELSPEPPHRDEVLDYEGYVRSMERTAGGREEAMPCARRSTFPRVRYPPGHAEEGAYHLDMARAFRVQTCPEVVRLYHQDADNRVMRPSAAQMLHHAGDGARDVADILAHHGDAFRRWAPTVFARMLQSGMLFHFLTGDRRAAIGYAVQRLRVRPVVTRTYVILIAGLLGPRPLAWLRTAWLRQAGRRSRSRAGRPRSAEA
jgi:glycosyltransferase involved in cell wall biosynthesis